MPSNQVRPASRFTGPPALRIRFRYPYVPQRNLAPVVDYNFGARPVLIPNRWVGPPVLRAQVRPRYLSFLSADPSNPVQSGATHGGFTGGGIIIHTQGFGGGLISETNGFGAGTVISRGRMF